MKRKSNNLIAIFVILILLPSIFIIPAINVILKNTTAIDLFKDIPLFAFISSIASSVSVIVGILIVYRQIEKEKKIYSNTFLISLNDYFATDENIKRCFKKLMKLEKRKYSFDAYEKEFETDEDKYDLLEYLNFMESLQYFISERVIKISEINELFCKRFFIAINNPYIQEIKLKKYDYSWVNLYRLAKSLIDYRREKGYQIPYEQYSLENMPNYEKYAKGNYDHNSVMANYFKIFIGASTVFLITFFVILYSVFNLSLQDVSKTISITGVIIGALALLFQKIEENNIDRARFLFELNKKFMMNNDFSYVFIKASKNFYHNNKIPKNYFVKSDEIFIRSYLNFFEVIYNLYEKGTIKMKEINFLFNWRFFIVANNKEVQDKVINKNKYIKNLFKLHNLLNNYRIKNGLNINYAESSLAKNKYYKEIVNE